MAGKIIGGLCLVMLIGLALVGCAATPVSTDNPPGEPKDPVDTYTSSTVVVLPSGRTVECVIVGYSQGGITCDWENAR